MIDFEGLLKFLFRFKWMVIVAAIVGGGAAYFFVQKLPNTYTSVAQVSVSTVTQSQSEGSIAQQRYAYLNELIKSRPLLNVLSYRLMLHDLEGPDTAFRAWSDALKSLSVAERAKVSVEFKSRLKTHRLLSTLDNEGPVKLYDLVHSMGYGENALSEQLTVSNNPITGMIEIQFASENPDLSVAVVNTLGKELIRYYHTITISNLDNALTVLDSIAEEKHQALAEKRSLLDAYRAGSGVSAVGQQSSALFSRVTQYEQQRADALRQMESLKGAIQSIEQKLDNPGVQNIASTNSEILRLDQQLKLANQRYVESGFLARDKKRIDSLQALRSVKLLTAPGQSTLSSAEIRRNLQGEKRSLETQLALVENSMASIESELASLRGRYSATMPVDANLQRYEQDVALATQEYTEALDRYNNEKTNSISNLRLALIQPGTPGFPETPDKLIYIAGAGGASASIAFAILCFMFFSDRKIVDASQLKEKTGTIVLAAMPFIKQLAVNLNELWSPNEKHNHLIDFKNNLRGLRFEVSEALDTVNGKVLLVTSLREGDGKTLLSTGLAYAFAATEKNTLLITGSDSDFLTPSADAPSDSQTLSFDTFLAKREIKVEDRITVLRTKSEQSSLMELGNKESIQRAFEVLKQEFDLIIIDSVHMRQWSEVQEWLAFSDRVITLFKSGSTVDEKDLPVLAKLKRHPSFMGWVFNFSR